MKKITNTIKHLSLILGILLALSYSNALSAQTEEDYEEEEESFFSDGINSSRFESNLSSDYETARPDYNYHRNQNQSNENAFGNSGPTPTYKELDIEVNREYSSNTGIGGGGGGGSSNGPNNTPNNYVPGVGNTVSTGGITPPIKGGTPGSYVPDNGGDPDAPIDGGIGFLIAAGIGYGLKQNHKKSKSKK
jgi:hypothetical protein